MPLTLDQKARENFLMVQVSASSKEAGYPRRAPRRDSTRLRPRATDRDGCAPYKTPRTPDARYDPVGSSTIHTPTMTDSGSVSLSHDSIDRVTCPICIELFDPMELRYKPCPCGYKVCTMCIHLIKEKAGGKCPNCRDDYVESRANISDSVPLELVEIIRRVTQESNKKPERKNESQSIRDSYYRRNPKIIPPKLDTSSRPPPPPPPPQPPVLLKRFSGGISVWD
jgi:hypothetical protein